MNSKKHWFAVYTKPQKESYTQFNLRARGLITFFPKLLLLKTEKRKEKVIPLFPNYLFCHCSIPSQEHSSVCWCPGVRRLVSFNGSPAVIDDATMGGLINQASPEGVIRSQSNVQTGQEVSINGGAFNGLQGIIERPPNARGRVKVLLELLNRPMSIDVPIDLIEGKWVPQLV